MPLVLEGVRKVFADLPYSHEFVLADDGSRDGSWGVIAAEHSHGDVCGIRFVRNHGHSTTFKRALEFCRGEWIITMDDDLQHPPEELPKLIAGVEQNPDVDVIMGKYNSSRDAAHRSLGSRLYQMVLRSSFNLPKDIVITSYRVIHRRVVDEIVFRALAAPHAGFMILAATDRVINVPVEHHERRFGQSGMTLTKSITTLMDGLLLNSLWPLRGMGLCGLFLAAGALLLALFYFVIYLVGWVGVSGFATLSILLAFSLGASMASISIVGLYIMRLVQQATFSPRYSLRAYLPHTASVHGKEALAASERQECSAGVEGLDSNSRNY